MIAHKPTAEPEVAAPKAAEPVPTPPRPAAQHQGSLRTSSGCPPQAAAAVQATKFHGKSFSWQSGSHKRPMEGSEGSEESPKPLKKTSLAQFRPDTGCVKLGQPPTVEELAGTSGRPLRAAAQEFQRYPATQEVATPAPLGQPCMADPTCPTYDLPYHSHMACPSCPAKAGYASNTSTPSNTSGAGNMGYPGNSGYYAGIPGNWGYYTGYPGPAPYPVPRQPPTYDDGRKPNTTELVSTVALGAFKLQHELVSSSAENIWVLRCTRCNKLVARSRTITLHTCCNSPAQELNEGQAKELLVTGEGPSRCRLCHRFSPVGTPHGCTLGALTGTMVADTTGVTQMSDLLNGAGTADTEAAKVAADLLRRYRGLCVSFVRLPEEDEGQLTITVSYIFPGSTHDAGMFVRDRKGEFTYNPSLGEQQLCDDMCYLASIPAGSPHFSYWGKCGNGRTVSMQILAPPAGAPVMQAHAVLEWDYAASCTDPVEEMVCTCNSAKCDRLLYQYNRRTSPVVVHEVTGSKKRRVEKKDWTTFLERATEVAK
ncbi:hypothetical protein HYH03_010609 [Edaphochlamys debaryana]|uniref:Post-SET domain-containing protein n=1 Tax=Edaphochlamys debaryana TaxID=47281 RepID=A0A836BWF8_9CHLO|nr:hypothetical protein HYH03_010609 [Edaphochlamys debaryana]|eukprot:KAG2490932.1 hypothetical protein HYH03_010609 [Edaphochlamys debaryana]